MVVYWSEDDDAYIAEVLELPGCMADGRTYEEAIKNTLSVIKEWIETAMELGREIPKPNGRLIYAQCSQFVNEKFINRERYVSKL
ncbi:MAG: type II toxin-antitoxin system HicB family antitoxin [Candidatus Methanoperedens sp.]|nr:type II toxin-antitoxin system HicB family antitoxin [Candidatus Methanoperedens sp.]